MTTKRMVQLRTQPLIPAELINAISTKNPIYREEEDAFLCNNIIFFLSITYFVISSSLHYISLISMVLENADLSKKTKSFGIGTTKN